jgi:ABC-type antimicrobial peptide transport system permease subunit
MVRAIREQIHSVDAGQPVSRTMTGEDMLRAHGWGREQFAAALFLVFAALALSLAATGLYSVVAYTTAQRSQEFGIRMALGARKADVVGLVLWSAAKTVGAGTAAGVVLSAAGRLSAPAVLAVVAVVLVAVTAVAAWVPARRAAGSDPARVLRGET